MHIFLDESGTFAKAQAAGSWCVVAGYVLPEGSHAGAKEGLRRFKVKNGFGALDEIKRKNLAEAQYFDFLDMLHDIDGIGIAVATDAWMSDGIPGHKENQAARIEAYAPNMIHAEGRQMIRDLATDIRRLSDQNYLELWCRVMLVYDVVQLATAYYAQRKPGTLSAFRWNFDQKDVKRTHFETTLERMMGPLLQSKTLRDPFFQLDWADYSKLDRFEFKGDTPWLPKVVHPTPHPPGLDIGKIWHESLAFVDSKKSAGVQMADLLTSGLRALIRGDFHDNGRAAEMLGPCMVSRDKNTPGLRFITLNEGTEAWTGAAVSSRVLSMSAQARPMLLKRS